MATATRIKADPIPTPPDQIQLTLSLPEARTLFEIIQRIGGNPLSTARKHTDAIERALYGLGVTSYGGDNIVETGRQQIYFNERSLEFVGV